MTDTPPTRHPRTLLRNGNRRLAALNVYTWTIPALSARIDGVTIRTCPAAGVCAKGACYALAGTYRWSNVRQAHEANLRFVVTDPEGWERAMITELAAPKFRGAWVRLHDAGDFFSDDYTRAWMRIMRTAPDTRFYAYTKEVRRLRELVEPDPPPNFAWRFSFGGREDHLIRDGDRVADVFPDDDAIPGGWRSQRGDDLIAADDTALVAIPANNLPAARRAQGDRTFSQWQAEDDAARGRPHCTDRVDRALHTQPRRGPRSLIQPASPHRATPHLATSTGEPDPATGELTTERRPPS
ncbi:hypothetical protein BS329_38810 [Amycolatopsis coloradensis]|uniref:Gene product 88 domain-containing protein n=1 Tax=Amycolatopsis coloradensis TaxID=76021 RepID=A0A1R0KES1_9PSEU|nr:hypothetical protein [Amycolatopsis coloradensis]OLZ43611.1 hypothetical protein BS329_38810 [Amycolatopsis coloradensis]